MICNASVFWLISCDMTSRLDSSETLLKGMTAAKIDQGDCSMDSTERKRALQEKIKVTWKVGGL